MTSQKGRKITWGKKISSAKMGHVVSIETRKKISIGHLGKTAWNKGRKMSDNFCKKISKIQKGRKLSDSHKNSIKNSMPKGSKHYLWIEDRSKLKKSEDRRKDSAYRYWRSCVKKRDNFKCKINNKECNGKLETHHILNWSKNKELRYDVKNGISLCHFHHPRKRKDEMKLVDY